MRPENNEFREKGKESWRFDPDDSKEEERRKYDLLKKEEELKRKNMSGRIYNDISFLFTIRKDMRDFMARRTNPKAWMCHSDRYAAAIALEIYERLNSRFAYEKIGEYDHMGDSFGGEIFSQIIEIEWSAKEMQKEPYCVKYILFANESFETHIDPGISKPVVDFDGHIAYILKCIQRILRKYKNFITDYAKDFGFPIPVID